MDLHDPIPFDASLRKRFYEPVILLYCLRYAFNRGSSTDPAELEFTAAERNSTETFKCFVNKLAQICDGVRGDGGKTITSCMVLQPGSVEYRLASNSRTEPEWATVKEYLTEILAALGEASDEVIRTANTESEIFVTILQKVIVFTRPRMEWYAKQVGENLDFCVRQAEQTGTEEARNVATRLLSLAPLVEFATRQVEDDNASFTRKTESLLRALNASYRNSVESFIRSKASGSREGPAETPWSAIHHAIGRLLSLFIAVKVLISARKFWPEAFVDFEVTHVASSVPDDEPPAIRRTALGIIKRMSADQTVIRAYQARAANLMEWNLDEKIKKVCSRRLFAPIVHAEILNHNSVVREDRENAAAGEEPVRFFREAEFGRYIGSSKPTCRLCEQYFAAYPDVRVRPSHHNLYYNWRLPDVYPGDGELVQLRNNVMERIIQTTRTEAFTALQRGRVLRNPFDSNNTPSNPLATTGTDRSSTVAAVQGLDDLVSRIGSMSIRTPGSPTSGSSRESTPQSDGDQTLRGHPGLQDEADE